jgi:hypothetical protein
MSAWMRQPSSFTRPYPTVAERRALAEAGGIAERQVANWFSNARKRSWKVCARCGGWLRETPHTRVPPQRQYVEAGHAAPAPGRPKKARGSASV